MTLFTKPDCKKCDYIKDTVDLKKLGVNVEEVREAEVSIENVENLAHLCWHEQKKTSETIMPILILNDSSAIIGAINIKNYLKQIEDNYENNRVDNFKS